MEMQYISITSINQLMLYMPKEMIAVCSENL